MLHYNGADLTRLSFTRVPFLPTATSTPHPNRAGELKAAAPCSAPAIYRLYQFHKPSVYLKKGRREMRTCVVYMSGFCFYQKFIFQ